MHTKVYNPIIVLLANKRPLLALMFMNKHFPPQTAARPQNWLRNSADSRESDLKLE